MTSTRMKVFTVVGVVFAALTWSVPTTAQVPDETTPGQICENPSSTISLFAEDMRNGKVGYGTAPGEPSIPGPTIDLTEGECVAISLTNNSGRRVSFHPHGVDYTVKSDGTRLNKSCVRPGRSRTYVIAAHAPVTRDDGTVDGGSAGYWHYHDHCMGTPHGTVGVSKGLFGALIVRRAGDPLPDRPPVVLVMSGTQINLKRAPKTPTPIVRLGERIEFVVIGHGELVHTFHLHGHRWADTRTGLVSGLSSNERSIDNKPVGPADSFGFQVIAGERVGPGAWMYHCHVQSHSDAGMEGLFVVTTEDGVVTEQARAALDAFRAGKHRHAAH